MYLILCKTLEKVTGDQLSLDFSQSVNAVNAEKNRYDNKVSCEFRWQYTL